MGQTESVSELVHDDERREGPWLNRARELRLQDALGDRHEDLLELCVDDVPQHDLFGAVLL